MPGLDTGDRSVALVLLGGIAFFLLSPFFLSQEGFRFLYSEEGVVETVSFFGWLFAAALVLWFGRPLGLPVIVFALLCGIFAAREADWQKEFTSDGFTKINYYEDATIS